MSTTMSATPHANINNMPELNFPENIQTWLDLLENEIAKKRFLLDFNSEELILSLKKALALNALNILVPENLNGVNLNLIQQHYYSRSMAKASGALAFLSAQHFSASSFIAASSSTTIKEKYLQQNLDGKYLFALAFSHLREINSPLVTATENKTSYTVNGTLRYVTGYKIFNMLLLGFVCKDKEILALTPFSTSKSFILLEQFNLVAMNSANTINCQLTDHVIDKSMVVSENSLGNFLSNSVKRGRNIVAFQLGLALAILELIRHDKCFEIDVIQNTHNTLMQKILAHETELFSIGTDETVIPIRAKIMHFLNIVFLFADTVFKGKSTSIDNQFFLIKKEAQIFVASAPRKELLIEICNLVNTTI